MFYLDEGIDTGDIIGQESFIIDKDDTSDILYSKIINTGKKLIKKYLLKLINNEIEKIPQDEKNVIEFISPKSNEIFLDDNVEIMYRKIRAFSKPYNGAYIQKDGKKLIIWKAKLIE